MQEIQNFYLQLLSNFPEHLRPFISIGVAVLIIFSIFKVVKRDFIWLVALIVLLPGSVPILKNIWDNAVLLVKFILNTK